MNALNPPRIARSVCPHDCPSTCALDIELVDAHTIGRVRGAKDDPYTAGVICEKVARYAERIHHKKRLLHPLRRIGKKGEGRWQQIGWDEAMAEIAERFLAIEAEDGPEGERSPGWIARQQAALDRSLALLATEPVPARFDMGALSLACALDYLLFRLPDLAWKERVPAWADWFAGVDQRSSMRTTDPRL